jgi:ABC-type lipoprotein release transport system permease subunit
MGNLFNIVMRIVSSLMGLLMIMSGSVWIMQGLGIGPEAIMRSFMANDPKWAFYGLILALLGIGQVVWSNKRQRFG